MTNTSLKLTAIKRLEKVPAFADNDIYLKILRYLVDAEEEGKNVKSTTIAIDLLGKSDGFNSNVQDSLIRNKVLKLRKELDLYYLSEGKREDYRLSIPKGQYKVQLTPLKPSKRKKTKIKMQLRLLVSIIAFLLITIICLLIFSFGKVESVRKNDFLVSYLMDTKKDLDIVVGSRGFYTEFDPEVKRHRFIYDSDIELPYNPDKFDSLKTSLPSRKIINSAFAFRHVDMTNVLIASKISTAWSFLGRENSIIESTEVKDVNMIKRNTVFVSKTGSGDLYDFGKILLHDSHFKFKSGFLNSPINITHLVKKDTLIPILNYLEYDIPKYIVVKKVRNAQGIYVLFLMPSEDNSRDYLYHRLSNKTFIDDILDSFGPKREVPNEFELLIEVNKNSSHKVVFNSHNEAM